MADRFRPNVGVVDSLAHAQFSEKKWVWVTDKEEVYVAGWITKEENDMVEVEFPDGKPKRKISVNDTEKMNPPKFDKVEDMAELTHLNEASVIHNLRLRYLSNLIYTYSGLFLVTVNPYKRLPIYSDDVVRAYKGKKRGEMAPHVFAVADSAYNDMLQDRENQSILITGESGAGKTENTKKVIQYLASIATSNTDGRMGTLEQQILQANPILESFGNAQTVRNNNSSRFGKFIRLEFNPAGQICGANIERYLLEKSRVTHQTSKERNYHIFYQLIKGAPKQIKDTLLLDGTLNDYNFTKDSRKDIELVDDESLSIMKMSPEEQLDLFRVIAAVLHLGNIQVVGDREDQAQMTEIGQAAAEKVCHVLGIPVQDFVKGLLKPKIKAGRDWVTQARTVSQVDYSLEALARALYERMFGSLVERINAAIYIPSSKTTFIGVLDIAGFEIFENNSFEQLCINYTNEKLQQFFNHHMFIIEQEEYRKEGIEWKFIDFGLDLQPTIDLIEKTSPIGILSCLDEECVMPKATDKTFLDKLNTLWKGKSSKYEVPRFSSGFILQHYAGKVEYNTNGWLDKNKDPLNENLTRLLANSTEKYIGGLFVDYISEFDDVNVKTRGVTKKGAFRTVAQRHKEQLISLMSQLYSTEPHFVRCIIPNDEKKAGKIQVNMVLEQLRCNGVLEGIRICRAGFPNRLSFADFRQRYELLAPTVIPKGFMDGKSGAQLLLEALAIDKNQYRIGTSKVFFRTGVLAELEELRDTKLSKIVIKIQSIARGYLARKVYKKKIDQCRAIKIIQKNARIYVTLREWSWWKLYTKVKPLLNVTRTDEELRKREEYAKEWEEKAKKEKDEKNKIEALRVALEAEKRRIEELLIQEKNAAADQAEILSRVQRREVDLTEELAKLNLYLEEKDIENENLTKLRKSLETDARSLREQIELEKLNNSKLEREKSLREQRLKDLENEIGQASEAIRKLETDKKSLEQQMGDLQTQLDNSSDQNTDLSRSQARLKATIAELEQKLENEVEENRKLEQRRNVFEIELSKLNETVADITKSKSELESLIKRKDGEILSLNERIKQDQMDKESSEKQRRDILEQLSAARADLEIERNDREKLLKAKNRLESELDSMTRLIEEKGSEETKQVELRKMREAELSELKNQLSSALADAESLRKSSGISLDKLRVELDSVRGEMASLSKSKAATEHQLNEVRAETERLEDARQRLDRAKKQLENDLMNSKARVDELEVQSAELKLQKENVEAKLAIASSRLDESESNANRLDREKQSLARQMDSLKEEFEAESKKTANLESLRKKIATELADLQAQAEEEKSARAELNKKLAAKQQELDGIKDKYQKDVVLKSNELEELRRRQDKEIAEAQQRYEELERNYANLEKTKSRLSAEIEDLRLEVEREHNAARNSEKLCKNAESQLAQVNNDLESERKMRELAESQARKLQANLESMAVEIEDKNHQIATIGKAKGDLEAELKALIGEIGDSGKNMHELEKTKRKLEAQIEDLQSRLEDEERSRSKAEDAKASLESQLNDAKRKYDLDLAAKDAQLDETRRMLMKEVNSIGEQLDEALQQKNELHKQKKKVEEQLDALTSRVENSAKGQSDLEKAKKKADSTIRELQTKLEEEEKQRKNIEELAQRHEKRANSLQSQIERLEAQVESLERAKKSLEKKVDELNADLNGGEDSKANLLDAKRKLEKENQRLQARLEEEEEARAALEAAKASGASELESLRSRAKEDVEGKIEKLEESRRALLAAQRLASQELEDRAKDISNLEKQKKVLQAEIDDLKASIEREVAAKLEESSARRKLSTEIKDLQSKLDAEIVKSSDMVEAIATYRSKVDAVTTKLESAELSRIKAEKSESSARIQLKEMEDSLREAIKDRKVAEDKVRSLEEQLLEMQERQDEDALELSDLQTVKRKLQEEIQQSLERNKRELEDRENILEQTRRKYQKEIKQLLSELEIEKNNNLQVKQLVRDKEAEIDSVSNRLEAELRSAASWKKDKEKLDAKVQDMTKAYLEALASSDEHSNQISNLLTQMRELRSTLEDSEAQKIILEKAKKTLESRLDELGEQYSMADRARNDLSKSVIALDQQAGELRETLEDYQDQARIATEKLRRTEQINQDIQLELDREKETNVDLQKSKVSLERQVKELNSRILDLEAVAMQGGNSGNKRLETRLDELAAQLDSEINEKGELQKNTRKMDRTLRELQLQLSDKDKAVKRYEEEMEKVDQKVKRMKQQIEELETSESNCQLAKRRAERECSEFRERSLRFEKEVEKLKLRLERGV
ncbi:hypothetical protein HDU76_004248 [Blyttiomyces sp. JEL0837]|nr:hypothetical protein HDU76_004248 [Blyttiomyces sp. JEL0837]